MDIINIIAVLITLSALFGYINARFIGLPGTIGILLIALFVSFGILLAGAMGVESVTKAQEMVRAIDFNQTLMQGMLSFLLFAGALHVNLDDLSKQKGLILGWGYWHLLLW